jgi:hypothetical protein
LTVLLAVPQQAGKAAGKKILVKGYVVDALGTPIEDASILVMASSAPGRPVSLTTKKDGYYEQELKKEGFFNISYHHIDAGGAVVNRLSGEKDQNVSVVLYKNNQVGQMRPDAVFGELAAYEFAAVMAHTEYGEAYKVLVSGDQFKTRLSRLQGRVKSMEKSVRPVLELQLTNLGKLISS